MPIGFSHIDIVGDKVRLRAMRAGDARIAYRLVANDAILSNLSWDGPANEEEVADTYRRWEDGLKIGEICGLAIEHADQPDLIGCITVRFPRHPQQANIGYWMSEPFWNKGYMTDAIRLACHLSFQHLDAVRVCATVFVGNIASRRALEKNGFSIDGTLRSHIFKRGEWRDAWFFTLLRSEWETNREIYQPRHEDVVLTKDS